MIQKLQFGGGRTDRGVSEVLGAILIFALLLILLVIIQTAAVPAMNQEIEFSHNQRVQGDMQSLGEQVDFTAARGAESSTTIEMGVRYPTRMFLLNPPPASGSLTTEATMISIENAEATDREIDDYWNGDVRNFDSRRLTYAPNYNEYAAAPDTVYEGWTLYNEHPNGEDITLDETSPVSDNRVRLVALDGTRGGTSVAPLTLTTEPLSVPEQTVTVTDDGSPITLRLQTAMSKETWDEILAGECADMSVDPVCTSGDGHITDWSVNSGWLTIDLEEGVTYELRMSKVGIGSQATDEDPYYMIAVDAPSSLDPSGTDLTVEVRDQFNTVVPGIEVTFTITGQATPTTATVTTDENGQATVNVDPTGDTAVTVVASADLEGDGQPYEDRERVEFGSLPVTTGDDGQDPSELNPNEPGAVIFEEALITSTGTGNNKQYFVDVTLRNLASDDKTIDELRVNFYGKSALGGRSGTEDLLRAKIDGKPTPPMQVRDPYVGGLALPEVPGNDGSETYRFEFLYEESGNLENFEPIEGDFFIVSVIFEDGTTARYFIDPRNP